MASLVALTFSLIAFRRIYVEGSRPPNILLVLADDLGYGDVDFTSVESGEELDTPFLNKLAKEGVVLDQLYGGPQCTPSRASLLTGKYPSSIGMQHKVATLRSTYALPKEERTMAQYFKELGYSTHLVGKWHLGSASWDNTPTFRGFDTFYGFHGGAQGYYSHMSGPPFMRGYDFWNGTEPSPSVRGEYSTWLFGNETCRLIHESTTDPDKPWFIMLSYQAVHGPMQAPPQFVQDYRNRGMNLERAIFGGMTTAMDSSIKGVYEVLEETGQENNTLVVFFSDNGGPVEGHSTNYPLRGGKHTLWEGGVRLAGFINGPMIHRTGFHFQGLLHVADWLPTLVAATGTENTDVLEEMGEIDGMNQWDALTKGFPPTRKEILLNYDKVTDDNWWGGYAGIRIGEFKLLLGDPGQPSGWCKPVQHTCLPTAQVPRLTSCCRDMRVPTDPHSGVRLYNLTSDPYEYVDLASEYPEIVDRLQERLFSYMDRAAEPLNGTPEQRRRDPRSNPSRFGGFWMPWLGQEMVSSYDESSYSQGR